MFSCVHFIRYFFRLVQKMQAEFYSTFYKLNIKHDEQAHVLLKHFVSMEVENGKKQMLCSICFIVF